MTHLFQPLDLTVNGVVKKYMKEFTAYYSLSVKQLLESGKILEDVDVDFWLTVIRCLHAHWFMIMFNFFTFLKKEQMSLSRGGIKLALLVCLMEPFYCPVKTLL